MNSQISSIDSVSESQKDHLVSHDTSELDQTTLTNENSILTNDSQNVETTKLYSNDAEEAELSAASETSNSENSSINDHTSTEEHLSNPSQDTNDPTNSCTLSENEPENENKTDSEETNPPENSPSIDANNHKENLEKEQSNEKGETSVLVENEKPTKLSLDSQLTEIQKLYEAEEVERSKLDEDPIAGGYPTFERLLNNIGRARKWYNQITLSGRQFVHALDLPDPIVKPWDDETKTPVEIEIGKTVVNWKEQEYEITAFRRRASLRWMQNSWKKDGATINSPKSPVSPSSSDFIHSMYNLKMMGTGNSRFYGPFPGTKFPQPEFLKLLEPPVIAENETKQETVITSTSNIPNSSTSEPKLSVDSSRSTISSLETPQNAIADTSKETGARIHIPISSATSLKGVKPGKNNDGSNPSGKAQIEIPQIPILFSAPPGTAPSSTTSVNHIPAPAVIPPVSMSPISNSSFVIPDNSASNKNMATGLGSASTNHSQVDVSLSSESSPQLQSRPASLAKASFDSSSSPAINGSAVFAVGDDDEFSDFASFQESSDEKPNVTSNGNTSKDIISTPTIDSAKFGKSSPISSQSRDKSSKSQSPKVPERIITISSSSSSIHESIKSASPSPIQSQEPFDKRPPVVAQLGPLMKPLSSTRMEQDKHVNEIVNSLPDLSFFFEEEN